MGDEEHHWIMERSELEISDSVTLAVTDTVTKVPSLPAGLTFLPLARAARAIPL